MARSVAVTTARVSLSRFLIRDCNLAQRLSQTICNRNGSMNPSRDNVPMMASKQSSA